VSALFQNIRRSIRRYHLLPPGTGVVVGLSGGSDSVALALILQDLSRHGGFQVAALAHLNHQIRPAAAADEAFCRAFARRIGLPIVVETADVPAMAARQHLSLEDAARRARYAFLRAVAAQVGATTVAVGHTRDDQAETVLLKLARGAGLTGLAAIYPRRDEVIRPLLDVSRDDLRAFLVARGESWVEDETNADLLNPRNRIRHEILPELETAYGGSVRGNLARVAALAREDVDYLDRVANARYSELCAQVPAVEPSTHGTLEVDLAGLADDPAAIRRRVLLRALRQLAPGREIGFAHVEAALEVAAGQTGAADLPGVRVELRPGKLVLIQQDAVTK
jgi:tRNA(Ile)-lysidine synthase